MKMRLEMLFAGVLLNVILCSVAFAGDNSIEKSDGYWNGRAWEKMSQTKIVFLMGLQDGIAHGIDLANANEKEAKKLLDEVTTTAFSFGEIIKVMDDFYSDMRNINIPITMAHETVCKSLNGNMTPEKEANRILYLRKFYSDKVGK